MDWKLELVIVPVADQDRAKSFYVEQLGWDLIVDHQPNAHFRVVQVNPPGSACAIALMKNPEAAGSVQGLHLVVEDIETARTHLSARGVDGAEPFHFEDGRQVSGPDPERRDYNTFMTFADPDGTGWMVQEVRSAHAGKVDASAPI